LVRENKDAIRNKMDYDFYKLGWDAALVDLGLCKEAAWPKSLARVGKFLKSKVPSKAGVKKFFIGSPRRFMHEFRSKKLLQPGSTLREGYRARSPLEKALLYGFPLYEGGRILTGDPGQRAENIGGLLGGMTLGLGAWGPSGMLGSIAAGSLGDYLGRGLARTAKHSLGVTPDVTNIYKK